MDALRKYPAKNPAPAVDLHGALCAAVIPAYDEEKELPETLKSVLAAAENSSEPVATVVVVNEPQGADAASSFKTLELLRNFPVSALYLPQLTGGVGAARKAGMDACCAAAGAEKLTELVICSLDADVRIAKEYFQRVIPAVRKCGGAVTIGFRHRMAETPEQEEAIRAYERYLDRYVALLREAGSPYAFHTVGSCFAVRGDGYCKAGGMRVKEAGEDFYFLQAAAKRCGLTQIREELVQPSPRCSARVPFGTGPAVSSLLAGKALDEIPDAAFAELKKILTLASDDAWLRAPQTEAGRLPASGRRFLENERFFEAWESILANLPDHPGNRQKAFHEWFDGLKTLRFLHFFIKNSAFCS